MSVDIGIGIPTGPSPSSESYSADILATSPLWSGNVCTIPAATHGLSTLGLIETSTLTGEDFNLSIRRDRVAVAIVITALTAVDFHIEARP